MKTWAIGTTSVIALALLSGCAATHKQEVLTTPASKLHGSNSVLIATPANGTYGDQEYSGSGEQAASAVRSAFLRHSNNVAVLPGCEELSCLQQSDENGSDYYVVPMILHWEDRATEWSGKRDKADIKLTIYDGEDLSEYSSIIIQGKSKWATFGGDHPQDLLPEPINEYVNSLYE